MIKQTWVAAAVLLAVGVPLVASGPAFPRAADPARAHADAKIGAPASPGTQGDEQDGDELLAPVLDVLSVEVVRSAHEPVLDIVRARGLTSSPGWQDAELVPLGRGDAIDGVLDLLLVAHAPEDAAAVERFEEIEAILPIESGHPYKGVRVHGASNAVTLVQVPGYIATAAPKEDCGKCVGKYFVAKGASVPAGKTDVVREEQLTAKVRVVRSTEGLSEVDSDPNRLTIVLGGDGRIVSAFWD